MEFAEYLSGALLKCVFPFFPDHDVFCLDPLSSKAMWWSISWKAIDLPVLSAISIKAFVHLRQILFDNIVIRYLGIYLTRFRGACGCLQCQIHHE